MNKIYFFISFLCVLSILSACTNSNKTRETLESSGFTDIEITGYSPFSCSEDDTYKTGFRAKNPKGNPVKGTVCCGLLKNCTIRF